MNEFLLDLQQYELAAVAVAGFAYALVFGIRNTFSLTVGLYIGICLLHQVIQDSLYQSGLLVWHSVYAITDFLYVFIVFFAHDALKIKFCKLSGFIVFGFIVLGFLQVAGYLDRAVFKHDYMVDAYPAIVVSINLTTTIAIVLFSIISLGYALIKHFKRDL